jgi:hypothetical protein
MIVNKQIVANHVNTRIQKVFMMDVMEPTTNWDDDKSWSSKNQGRTRGYHSLIIQVHKNYSRCVGQSTTTFELDIMVRHSVDNMRNDGKKI